MNMHKGWNASQKTSIDARRYIRRYIYSSRDFMAHYSASEEGEKADRGTKRRTKSCEVIWSLTEVAGLWMREMDGICVYGLAAIRRD